jgi:tetratricopeptide (TPR) repeat protein
LHRDGLAILEKLVDELPGEPEYRQDLAYSYNGLALILSPLGRVEEAEAAYRKAIGVREKLIQDRPGNPTYRADLAVNHSNLGILEKLCADFPTNSSYAVLLGEAAHNRGSLLRQGQPEAALECYAKALTSLQTVLETTPEDRAARRWMREILRDRAVVLSRLKRQATKDWDRALDLANGLADAPEPAPHNLYEAARVYALASLLATTDARPGERSASRAVALLAKARDAGYFKEPAVAERLKTDPDLDSLRSRADFKRLVAGLEARSIGERK